MINLDIYLPKVLDTRTPPVGIPEAGEKSYIILDGIWMQVPKNLFQLILDEARVRSKRSEIKIEPIKTWPIQGSTGLYTVKLQNGVYSCTCKGYEFKGHCSHIEEVKGEIKGRKYHKWKSDTGKTTYTITETEDEFSCSCSTFKKNGNCKHVEDIKKDLH